MKNSSGDFIFITNSEVRKTFRQTLTFQKSDHIPHFEAIGGLWPETVERWHKEGLPKKQIAKEAAYNSAKKINKLIESELEKKK